jgi:hypothetical protein
MTWLYFSKQQNKTIIQTIKYYESIFNNYLYNVHSLLYAQKPKYSLNLMNEIEGWITMNLEESKIGFCWISRK